MEGSSGFCNTSDGEVLIVLRLSNGSRLLRVDCQTTKRVDTGPMAASVHSTNEEEPETMHEGRYEPGWMERQFEKARRDVEAWPDWKKRLAGVETADTTRKVEPPRGNPEKPAR